MNSLDWNSRIVKLPGASFLQTAEWAEIKKPNGWQNEMRTWSFNGESIDTAALILERRLMRLPVSVVYCPRGPLVDWSNLDQVHQVLSEMIVAARERNAIYLKIDPDLAVGVGLPGSESDIANETGVKIQDYLRQSGWIFSKDQIQFRNTVEVDVRPAEDELLANMHQKTRYNIRLAERKGVVVSEAGKDEWKAIYRLYAETADRDGFVIRPWEYYEHVWEVFIQGGMAHCLKAEVNGSLTAAIWVVGFGRKAHYLYGMSGSEHREFMPNHLLQWKGMLLAKSQGRAVYDMWGAPNDFNAPDALSGVFRFKQGFGGTVVRTLGAWDFPIRPNIYRLYTGILPRIMDVMRQRGKIRTKQNLTQ